MDYGTLGGRNGCHRLRFGRHLRRYDLRRLSLAVGYAVPRLFRVGRRQAIASSFEIGIHNATLAIVIAQTVLGSVELSLPAAVYGVLMFFIAFGFGFLIREQVPEDAVADPPAAEPESSAAS